MLVLIVTKGISIHALRVEGDCAAEDVDSAYDGFLSTPSGWRATNASDASLICGIISIHALRVEGDAGFQRGWRERIIISIHALRVEGDYHSGHTQR